MNINLGTLKAFEDMVHKDLVGPNHPSLVFTSNEISNGPTLKVTVVKDQGHTRERMNRR